MTADKKTFVIANILREAGIAAIPVKTDKKPLVEWRKYIEEIPDEKDVIKWFSKDAGIALIAGKVQCLDFDEKYSTGIFSRFVARSEEVGLDFILGELIRQKTPSGGFHLVWQCEERASEGNRKLAEKPNHECMIETRGRGGYFLISPSTGYTLEQGDWSSIPAISGEDHDALLSLAGSFDERPPIEPSEPSETTAPQSTTPGDDYDMRADIPALLVAHGWHATSSAQKYWTRPGKKSGISASWNVVPDRFFVFSSSTQFQPKHVYKPWHVYAILECGGDFKRAAMELRRQGFGTVAKKKAPVDDWIDPIGATLEPDYIDGCDPFGEAPTHETEEDKIRRLFRARKYDPTRTPPPLRPVYTIGGIVISTPGNITAIIAPAKVGKSALVSAMTAAAMTKPEAGADCLTAVGYNAENKALLYFDTEQSPDDFWYSVNRAKDRAREAELPDWIHAYGLADLPTVHKRKGVSLHMADMAEIHGGIHSVIIDGVADLVLDVNDAEECNGLVSELHSLAIRHDCSIICVLHVNPGTDKARGHLGSQIERKAESNLKLEKDDSVTVVWSSKQRRAPIDKKTGPKFAWSDELKMHVSVTQADPRTKKVLELYDMAVEAFNGAPRMRYVELAQSLVKNRDMSEPTAKRRIQEMRKTNVLQADKFGLLNITPNEILPV